MPAPGIRAARWQAPAPASTRNASRSSAPGQAARVGCEQPIWAGVEEERSKEGPGTRRRYVRIEEAAAYTSLTVRHLHDLTRLGRIPHLRVGRVVIYDLDALDEWLAGFAHMPAEPPGRRTLGGLPGHRRAEGSLPAGRRPRR